MGIVFKAVRETDGEVVALKVLRGELSGDGRIAGASPAKV